MSAANLSFYARIDNLVPNYQAQPAKHGPHSFWSPPTIRTGYTRTSNTLFRWRGGIMTQIPANDPVNHALNVVHSAATVFTQYPHTPHLLVVPFNAQSRHAYQNPGGWRPITFRHVRINNTQHTYSAVLANGDRQHIAAQGSPHWMPQLLPSFYYDQGGSTRVQAGLIGSIPLLIALAAFSAPPPSLPGVLTSCLQPGQWLPHQYQYPSGRKSGYSIFFQDQAHYIQMFLRGAWSSQSSSILTMQDLIKSL